MSNYTNNIDDMLISGVKLVNETDKLRHKALCILHEIKTKERKIKRVSVHIKYEIGKPDLVFTMKKEKATDEYLEELKNRYRGKSVIRRNIKN